MLLSPTLKLAVVTNEGTLVALAVIYSLGTVGQTVLRVTV